MMRSVLTLSWQHAFVLSTTVACAGSVLHSLELLSIRQEFEPGGLLSWRVLRTSHPVVLRSGIGRYADWWLSPPGLFLLIAAHLLSAVIVVGRAIEPPVWALCTVVAIRSVLNFRNAPAVIGADQMQMLVLVPCVLYLLAPSPVVAQACGWFIALQLMLAYVTAGLAKLVSPMWRSGRAMGAILRTPSIGLHRGFLLAERHPALARLACWGVILFEVAAPWLLFSGGAARLAFLAAGVVFHTSIALVMGFDEFLWAYVAAYPVALRCAIDLDRWCSA